MTGGGFRPATLQKRGVDGPCAGTRQRSRSDATAATPLLGRPEDRAAAVRGSASWSTEWSRNRKDKSTKGFLFISLLLRYIVPFSPVCGQQQDRDVTANENRVEKKRAVDVQASPCLHFIDSSRWPSWRSCFRLEPTTSSPCSLHTQVSFMSFSSKNVVFIRITFE